MAFELKGYSIHTNIHCVMVYVGNDNECDFCYTVVENGLFELIDNISQDTRKSCMKCYKKIYKGKI